MWGGQPVGLVMGSRFDEVYVLGEVLGLKVGKWWFFKGGLWSVGNLMMRPFDIAQIGWNGMVWSIICLVWQGFGRMAWKIQKWKVWCIWEAR